MSHYFSDNRDLPHDFKKIKYEFNNAPFTFITDSGVFSKSAVDFGSDLLLKTVFNEELGKSILDLGCGYGVISIVLKKFKEIEIMGVDINPRAIELSRKNATLNNVEITYKVSHGFKEISRKFDTILLNPPIRTGKDNIYQMFDDAYLFLNDKSSLWIVIRKQQGALSALKKLSEKFTCNIINRSKGYWIIKADKS